MCCNHGLQRALKWYLVRLIRLCAVIAVTTVIGNYGYQQQGENGPAHEILVLIAYAQSLFKHAYGDSQGLKFGLSLHLLPYFELLCKKRDIAIII